MDGINQNYSISFNFNTNSKMEQILTSKLGRSQNFAVIGAGISGLSTAFYLSRSFPKCSVTVFEKNNHVGGWLNTQNHAISQAHSRTIELGARLIRNDA